MLKHSLKQTLSRTIIPRKLLISYISKSIRQVNNLAQLVDTANQEEIQRTGKYLEYTTKVYKPSQRITFNREGELLLFSCDNIRHNQIYLKYPYVLYNSLILLSAYNFFVDPLTMSWYWRHGLFYFLGMAGWLPQYFYIRSLGKKIYKIYLMKGGKYCKVVLNQFSGERMTTWITIKDLHLLSQDFRRYDDKYDFLTAEGQLKHEVATELDYFLYQGYPQNNDVIYFMKEGTVHQPEVFENVLRGYNIDTSDYEINTEDNIRWMEPSLNY